MKIADLSIDRPLTITMIIMAMILIGVVSIPLLQVDLYPEMTIPTINVSTSWQGASPEEVENRITKPVENVMSTVTGLQEINSSSGQGSSRVTLSFNYNVDLDQATMSMRDKLDRVRRRLPDDADAPTIMKFDPNTRPIMTVAIAGNLDPLELNRLATDTLVPRLEQVEGVASTSASGGKTRQIQIQVDPARMQAYGLSINQVVQALQNDNTSADVGIVNQGDRTLNLRIKGDLQDSTEFRNVAIRLSSGSSIKIQDIASVEDTFADVTQKARVNKENSVSINIQKVSDGNTVQVSDSVRKALQDMQKELPASVKVMVLSDQAKFIKQSIKTVVEHSILGALFAVMILLLFLRKLRIMMIVAIVIPISIISTFSLMYFSKQTINTVTLGGLALGLGSLVDFAVVIIESIFRYRSQGYTAVEGAKQGTSEVGTAVMASALAQICVFLPIFFSQGLARQMFAPLALTVIFSHLAALFGSLTLIPMLASRLMRASDVREIEGAEGGRFNPIAAFQRCLQRLTSAYRKLLVWSLSHRRVVILTMLGLLLASLSLIPQIGFVLTPYTDQGQFNVNINMPVGTRLEITDSIVTRVDDLIRRIPEVETIYTQAGGGSRTDSGRLEVNLKPRSERKRSTGQVVEELRRQVTGFGEARITVREISPSMMFGRGGGGSSIQVQVKGDDVNVLQKIIPLIEEAVASVPGTRNVQNSLERQIPQYQIVINREMAAQYGLTVGQISSALRSAYQGSVATQFRTGDNSVDVIVKYPQDFSRQIENLSRVTLSTQSGAQVALGDLAEIKPSLGPQQIVRNNQTRQITIQSDLSGVNQGEAQQAIAAKLEELSLPDGYLATLGGQARDMNESYRTLGLAMPFAIILVYMVLVGQFESFFSPFIIMFALPPTFIGAAFGLFVTGRPLSINALTGIILLIGIVLNNSIVLVDYTNQLRAKGLSRDEAIIQAGPIRLRPILMTSSTTVLAMIPLAIGFGEGAEAQAPMATVVAFGLAFSTLITLVLVPVMYASVDDFANALRRIFRQIFKPASSSKNALRGETN